MADLLDIYNRAFGTKYSAVSTIAIVPPTSLFSKQDLSVPINEGSKFQNEEIEQLSGEKQSLLGTAIFFPCSLDNYDLPNEPLISISGKNRIIKTEIDGNEGTFKEFFSRDDYDIVIRGIAINEDNPDDYPVDIVRKLRQLAEKAELDVTNKLLGYFNVKQLVIESYSFPAVEGTMMQPYEFKCLSDKTFDLELLDADA